MKLASGVCRVPDMLELGVPLGLAVDGSASNDGSNLMSEIRAAYLLHRLSSGKRAPAGYDLLKLATRGGAHLMGRDDIGSIEAGKAADLFLLDVDALGLAGAHRDPANLLGTVGYSRPAKYVVVNGRVVVRGGRLTGIDEEKIARRADELAEGMLRRAEGSA
jgi:cytosine/adenosine deaminase-related metal-dependent hydrolase